MENLDNQKRLENLIYHIRNEDVVLWIGAGLSKYAGLPLGSDIVDIIKSKFDKKQRVDLAFKNINSLQRIAELYQDKYGRDDLIRILKEEILDKQPNNSPIHEQLANISHFKTIITTNFDNLIECTDNGDYCKIVGERDIVNLTKNKRTLIKLHGDFSLTDSLVITNTDYRSFYFKNFNTLVWDKVRTEISSKVVAFLGYSLSDDNILAQFENITSILGSVRKDIYFITPNIDGEKKALLNKFNIEHINLDAQAFLDEVVKYIQLYLFADLKNKVTSAETVQRYSSYKKLDVTFKSTNNRYEIEKIEPINGFGDYKINFTTSDIGLTSRLNDVAYTEDIVVSTDLVSNYSFCINDIRHPLSDEKGILIIKKVFTKTISNIRCKGKCFEIKNIQTKLYRSLEAALFVFVLKCGVIKAHIKKGMKADINITLNNGKHPIKSLIEFYKLLFYVFIGEEIFISNELGFNLIINETLNPTFRGVKNKLDYLQKLEFIEEYLKVKFDNIDTFSESDWKNADYVYNNIKGNLFENRGDISIRITPNPNHPITTTDTDDEYEDRMIVINDKLQIVYLHGREIVLGYQVVEIRNPIFLNLDSFKSGEELALIMNAKEGNYKAQCILDIPKDANDCFVNNFSLFDVK